MKRRLKVILGGFLLGALLAVKAGAVNPDTLVLSVTPGNITYGVQITSPAAGGYDFALANLGDTTVSTLAISVKNVGNVSEYLALSISNTAQDGWTPISSGIPGDNQFKMLAHLVNSGSGQPASTSFDVNLDTVTASIPNTGGGRYGQSSKLIPALSKDLYLKLTMPSTVTSDSAQTMTLTVNGQAN